MEKKWTRENVNAYQCWCPDADDSIAAIGTSIITSSPGEAAIEWADIVSILRNEILAGEMTMLVSVRDEHGSVTEWKIIGEEGMYAAQCVKH